MSDTKTLIKYVRDRLNDGPNITFGKPTVRDLVDTLEQAEANVERLTKERDWLSEKCAMHCHDKDGDEMCSYDACGMFNCWHVSECEWKEAARKYVDGEGK